MLDTLALVRSTTNWGSKSEPSKLPKKKSIRSTIYKEFSFYLTNRMVSDSTRGIRYEATDSISLLPDFRTSEENSFPSEKLL